MDDLRHRTFTTPDIVAASGERLTSGDLRSRRHRDYFVAPKSRPGVKREVDLLTVYQAVLMNELAGRGLSLEHASAAIKFRFQDAGATALETPDGGWIAEIEAAAWKPGALPEFESEDEANPWYWLIIAEYGGNFGGMIACQRSGLAERIKGFKFCHVLNVTAVIARVNTVLRERLGETATE